MRHRVRPRPRSGLRTPGRRVEHDRQRAEGSQREEARIIVTVVKDRDEKRRK